MNVQDQLTGKGNNQRISIRKRSILFKIEAHARFFPQA